MSNNVRRAAMVAPLILSIGVPYLMVSDTLAPQRATVTSWFGAGTAPDAHTSIDPSNPGVANDATEQTASTTATDLRQVLRFDITPRWVLENWPHVSTTRAEQNLDGLRVVLVTGTRPQDIAGSLTYYFAKNRQLQRITLQGYTGDDRYLTSIVTQAYHLQSQPTPSASLYVSKWNGRLTSALCLRRMPIIQANDRLHRYEVLLELNRPDYYTGLSPQFAQQLAAIQLGPMASMPTAPPPARSKPKAKETDTRSYLPPLPTPY